MQMRQSRRVATRKTPTMKAVITDLSTGTQYIVNREKDCKRQDIDIYRTLVRHIEQTGVKCISMGLTICQAI